jgi:hypothetical protein
MASISTPGSAPTSASAPGCSAPARRSLVISGAVAEWEDWAGMAFPQTGRYVVPGALDLVHIDRGRDRGVYAETNLWMRHG